MRALLLLALTGCIAEAQASDGVFYDEAGGQCTTSPGLTMSGDLDMGGHKILNQGNSASDGTSSGGMNYAGDFSVATNKFTVASASGNTTVAGTLGVTGASTFAAETVNGTATFNSGATFNNSPTFSAGTYMASNDGVSNFSAYYIGNTNSPKALLGYYTADTPDTTVFGVSSDSEALVVCEAADAQTDFGHALQTDPTIFVHSHNASPTTEYRGYKAAGTQGELFKALTKGSATSVVRIPIASGVSCGGEWHFTIMSIDGTERQVVKGRVIFGVENKAGTETCTLGTTESVSNVSGGTVTLTGLVCDTSPTNAVDLQINATTSLTPTVFRAYYHVDVDGPCEPLPQ